MLKIKFEYRDEYTRGNWSTQEGVFSTLEECKEWYGLGIDCEYRIISIEKVEDQRYKYGTIREQDS